MGHVRHTRRTKERVLEEFSERGRIDYACLAVGVDRRSHYRWLKDDPEYLEAFNLAQEMAVGKLEDEAYLRAREGVWKPIFHSGVHVASVRESSDTLLMFLLKARRPEVYRERYDVKASGSFNVVNVVQSILQDASSADID